MIAVFDSPVSWNEKKVHKKSLMYAEHADHVPLIAHDVCAAISLWGLSNILLETVDNDFDVRVQDIMKSYRMGE